VADTRVVKVVFGVPDTMIQRIRLGDLQSITTLTVPGEIRGRVTSISPSADPKSRVFSVEVSIANADNRLKPGMIATLALGIDKAMREAATVVVPLSAVIRSSKNGGAFAVFVVTPESGMAAGSSRLAPSRPPSLPSSPATTTPTASRRRSLHARRPPSARRPAPSPSPRQRTPAPRATRR